ncbi:hypothetical protein ACE6H2_022727 [Prunus campanulata]
MAKCTYMRHKQEGMESGEAEGDHKSNGGGGHSLFFFLSGFEFWNEFVFSIIPNKNKPRSCVPGI